MYLIASYFTKMLGNYCFDQLLYFLNLTECLYNLSFRLAFQSLQNIPSDLPEWRHDVLTGFVHFIQREVGDAFPQLLEQSNRRLLSLLTQWKTVAQAGLTVKVICSSVEIFDSRVCYSIFI